MNTLKGGMAVGAMYMLHKKYKQRKKSKEAKKQGLVRQGSSKSLTKQITSSLRHKFDNAQLNSKVDLKDVIIQEVGGQPQNCVLFSKKNKTKGQKSKIKSQCTHSNQVHARNLVNIITTYMEKNGKQVRVSPQFASKIISLWTVGREINQRYVINCTEALKIMETLEDSFLLFIKADTDNNNTISAEELCQIACHESVASFSFDLYINVIEVCYNTQSLKFEDFVDCILNLKMVDLHFKERYGENYEKTSFQHNKYSAFELLDYL